MVDRPSGWTPIEVSNLYGGTDVLQTVPARGYRRDLTCHPRDAARPVMPGGNAAEGTADGRKAVRGAYGPAAGSRGPAGVNTPLGMLQSAVQHTP
jgi:hypothetical protein